MGRQTKNQRKKGQRSNTASGPPRLGKWPVHDICLYGLYHIRSYLGRVSPKSWHEFWNNVRDLCRLLIYLVPGMIFML
jgi:hypothetical protein